MTRRDGRAAPRAPAAVRRLLAALHAAALAAVDPEVLVHRALVVGRRTVRIRRRGASVSLPLARGVVVIGAGKGAAGLAASVERVLGRHVVGGLVVVPRGYERPLAQIAVRRGGHPLPDRGSLAATRALVRTLDRFPDAAVLVVLTGGASSLLAAPAPGLTLADERATAAWLLASGLDIVAANVVRKHVSTIKGGGLAARLVGRPAAALVVSDVPTDDLATIGSGPTVADPSTYADALRLVAGVRAARPFPPRVRRHLTRGARGAVAETPKPGSAAARACPTVLLAGNATARAGAVAAARRRGVARVVARRRALVGATADAAEALAAAIRRCRTARAPTVLVAGGETTVRLGRTPGRGGRNQALAAAVACVLDGRPGWALLAAGSDGVDGPTDAAGAFADGASAARARAAGVPLARALARHDVYPALARLGDLFRPGPTGTNVADLVVALVWRNAGWRLPARVIQARGRR